MPTRDAVSQHGQGPVCFLLRLPTGLSKTVRHRSDSTLNSVRSPRAITSSEFHFPPSPAAESPSPGRIHGVRLPGRRHRALRSLELRCRNSCSGPSVARPAAVQGAAEMRALPFSGHTPARTDTRGHTPARTDTRAHVGTHRHMKAYVGARSHTQAHTSLTPRLSHWLPCSWPPEEPYPHAELTASRKKIKNSCLLSSQGV